MPEHNAEGLIIVGTLREPRGQILVEQGDSTNIEHTKIQARSLVSGPDPACFKVWIVRTIWEATPDA